MGGSGGGGSPVVRVIEKIVEVDGSADLKKKNKTKSEASSARQETQKTGGAGVLTNYSSRTPTLTASDDSRKNKLGA